MNKKKYGFLFLVGLLASCNPNTNQNNNNNNGGTDEMDNKVNVIVMLGQSNMEGHSHHEYLIKTMGEEKAKEYINGYEDTKISYACLINLNSSNGEFVDVKVGQGTAIDRFGPEVGMAEFFHNNKTKEPVYLIKFAQGATSLYNEWLSPSSGRTGSLYGSAVEYILNECKKLEEQDLYPEIKTICWMQGEDDSSSSNYNKYEEYEYNFINDLRKDLLYYSRPEGIGFIDAGISDCPAWTHYKIVNKAKENNSLKNDLNRYFSTIDLGLKYNAEPIGNPDIYHYDSSSMIKLGNEFARLSKEFLI